MKRSAFLAISVLLVATACGGGRQPLQATPSYAGGAGPSMEMDSHAGAADPRPSYYDDRIAPQETQRPGLGTVFGEHRVSTVTSRRFERDSNSAFASVVIHYNDQEGIMAHARYTGSPSGPLYYRLPPSGGLTIEVIGESGVPLPGGFAQGRNFVVGQDGHRYSLRITNHTALAYEVVASVDGLDVVDGHAADTDKRGYIIAPYQTLEIDGFRTSMSSVAAFRFGSVRESYAARTGQARNVGVIGFAFFVERGRHYPQDEIYLRDTASPFPGDPHFAPPPGAYR